MSHSHTMTSALCGVLNCIYMTVKCSYHWLIHSAHQNGVFNNFIFKDLIWILINEFYIDKCMFCNHIKFHLIDDATSKNQISFQQKNFLENQIIVLSIVTTWHWRIIFMQNSAVHFTHAQIYR